MKQDLKFALRQLIRQRALSVVAVITLALGIAASIAVFTVVNAILLRPLPYPDPDRVVSLRRAEGGGLNNGSHRDVAFLRDSLRGCAPVGAATGGPGVNVVLSGEGGQAAYARDRLASARYFEALGIVPRWGRGFTLAEDTASPARVAIVSERLARGAGLEPASLVGRDISLGAASHSIVGVLALDQQLASDPDVYRPLGNDARGAGTNLDMVCRLAEGATIASLNAELRGLTEDARKAQLIRADAPRAYNAWSRHETEFGSIRPRVLTLLGAVILVLLVAASNATGLLLVRAAGRRREIAVRTALGATPGRIARTLIAEGVMLAGLAGVIGLLASPLLVQGLLAVAPSWYVNVALFTIDRSVIAAATGLCAIVGFVISLPPLFELLRVNVRDTLQEDGGRGIGGGRTRWIRDVLISAETAICVVLLVGALLLVRTFANLVNAPTGFDPTGVVTARMSVQGPQYAPDGALVRFFEDGLARLEQSPSIEVAAVAASLPTEFTINLPARFPDSAEPNKIEAVNWRYVSPRYFELLRIRHLSGRLLSDADRSGAAPVALVNETWARQRYGGAQEALGRRIVLHPITKDINDPIREIVGVVADTAGFALGEPPRATMFVPLAQVDSGVLRSVHAFFPPRWVVRGARDPDGARRALETVLRDLDPTQPFVDVTTMEGLMITSVALQRFYLVVLLAFAVLGVVLASIGIYASYSYAVASRMPEIGVRLALGAAPGRIFRGIVLQGLRLGVIAIGFGLLGALAAARVLRSILYNVTTTDPLTYFVVGTTLLATVLIATLMPAWRASRVDPLIVIRR